MSTTPADYLQELFGLDGLTAVVIGVAATDAAIELLQLLAAPRAWVVCFE